MLSQAPERNMRAVRAVLLLGWVVILASLLYDPVTPSLTSPDNFASPFRLGGPPVIVQGVPLALEPYPMGNRIFWTVIVPIVPLFLMVFGHETWRRICPLSLVSQIPRILGWQRRVKSLNRSAGRVDRVLALVPNNSWMRRNHYYFQFGFLSLGVIGRILFYNSDRLALFGAILFILLFAFAVGLIYGGKTWCNYFCPVAVIQAAYTGPGGLLDTKAHIAPSPVAQSMCRAPFAGGDHSTCVGCTMHCPDADLENSYWKRVESEPKRLMIYGLFGLVFAFNTYFYLYSGGLWYYESGAWTHESSQLSTLMGPGFFIAGHALPIPKIVAVPIYFVVCIAASYGLFALVERSYGRLCARFGRPLNTAQLRHRMFTIAGFLTIITFYWYSGRSNISLLPSWAARLLDLTVAALAITWLISSLSRDADNYLRERLGRTLRQQLVRMGFRSEDVLEGRAIEQLTAEEVYVLAKTLPNFSAAQKREAYRHILVDALETGQTHSSNSLQMLRDVREQLGLSDADHAAIAEAVGIQDPSLLDMDSARSIELRQRRENYRKFLLDLIQEGLGQGVQPAVFLASPAALNEIDALRGLFGVSEEEHARIFAEVTHDDARFVESARKLLDAFRQTEAFRFSLATDDRPEARLVRYGLLLRQKHLIHDIVAVVASIDAPEIARSFAQSIYALASDETDPALLEAIALRSRRYPRRLPAFDVGQGVFLLCGRHRGGEARGRGLGHARRGPRFDRCCARRVGSCRGRSRERRRPGRQVLATRPGAFGVSRGIARDGAPWPASGVDCHHGGIAFRGSVRRARFAVAGQNREGLRSSSSTTPATKFAWRARISDLIFLLVSGETETWVDSDQGRFVLGRGDKGTVFGELGVITRRPRSASVEVCSDRASAVSIPKAIVDDLLERDLPATRGILQVVSGYLLNTISATAHSSHPLAPNPSEAR